MAASSRSTAQQVDGATASHLVKNFPPKKGARRD